MPHRFNRRLLLTGLASFGTFAALPRLAQTRAAEQARGPANLTAGTAPLARRLADYVQSIRFSDLDAPTIERAKVHLLDSLGCGLSAFAEETVKSVRELAVAAGGNAATIIGTKQRTTLEWAAFANGAAIRADDINDGYSGGNGHPSDNIAACLPVAEAEGASGADLLLSMVLAYEIQCRLLDARRAGEEDWDHPNYALAASALAAGKLMKLSAPQLNEAISLALTGHLSMRQTRLGELSNWKGLAGPDAARNGVFAAQLARAGISGPGPIFEGDAGFFKLVSGPMNVDTGAFGGRAGRVQNPRLLHQILSGAGPDADRGSGGNESCPGGRRSFPHPIHRDTDDASRLVQRRPDAGSLCAGDVGDGRPQPAVYRGPCDGGGHDHTCELRARSPA